MTTWKRAFELPAGLLKEIVRHPSSTDKLPPFHGDEVQLHFTITAAADGRTLQTSKRDSAPQEPYKYKVGNPKQFFHAFDLAVKSLRKGEHARFTVPSRLAYGDEGCEALGVKPGDALSLELELISCPSREDLFNDDGGVIKLQTKEGSAKARMPRKNDDVQISYKVLARAVTDSSSSNRNGSDDIHHEEASANAEDVAVVVMQAQHKVNRCGAALFGSLGKAVDKAMLTMKRGDEVTLTCQPRHAFAADGQSEHAGKAAVIQLALEEIHEVYDTSLGLLDGTVLRKRIKEGPNENNEPKIVDGSQVTLKVRGVVANGVEVLPNTSEVSFRAGNGDVCDALEGAAIGLRVGDEAVLRCLSKESCTGSLLNLPEDANPPIMVHIEVMSLTAEKDKWDMTTCERIARARECKEVAGNLFRSGRTRLAAQHYERIADYFTKTEFISDEQERASAVELRRLAKLNAAMCMLKLGQYELVKELCSFVLKEDPCCAKAYFRRGKALLELKENEGAVADFGRLLELEPNSTEGKQLLRDAKRRWKEDSKGSKFAFSKMMTALNDFPERSAGRSDSDVVVMPNIDEEWAKLARETGIPFRTTPPPPKAAVAADAAAAHESSGERATTNPAAATATAAAAAAAAAATPTADQEQSPAESAKSQLQEQQP